MSMAYRSAYDHIVGARLTEVASAWEALDPTRGRLERVVARRAAGMIAGVVGLAGAIAMVFTILLDSREGWGTYVLLGSAIAAVGSYVLVRVLLAGLRRVRKPATVPTLASLSGQLDRDLAALDALDPVREWLRQLGTTGNPLVDARGSVVFLRSLPLFAVSLLTPLTLHWLFVEAFGTEDARSYEVWIKISAVIVGHAHLALCFFSYRFVQKLVTLSDEEFGRLSVHLEWAKALGLTVLVAAIPGVILFAIPPLLSTITGLVFIPFMFFAAHRQAVDERALRAAVEDAQPPPPPSDVLRIPPALR